MGRHRNDYETTRKFDPTDPKQLAAWIRDMALWGQDVRDDIIRLEGAAGISSGDPGDPPPPVR